MPSGVNRSILITGVSGEMGSYLARHYLGAGWTVLGLDQHVAGAATPPGLVFSTCDLADGIQATAAIDELVQAHGACDVLVNCAGRIANAPLVRLIGGEWTVHDFALWDSVIAANLTTAFHATAMTVKHMVSARKKGVVINVGSVCAKGSPGQAAYSAAKAGLNGFTLALAKELGPIGIRVVGLAPGYFDTASMHANVPEARLGKVIGAVPLKRLGVLSEVASAIDFIIHNDYTNGTIVEVNGGLVL